MAGKFTLEAVFRAVDKMSAPVQRMAKGLDKFQSKASKGLAEFDGKVSKVTESLKMMAATAAIVGAAAGAVALNIGKTGADFEQAITNVGAVSLMTRDQIADLEAKALELGATTKFSATEVANAMEMMGKAGFTNAEVLSGVGGILAAAAAEGAGLEETASNVSNVLKGMGLATSEAGRVADVLTLASARTNSSISSLGESMKNVSSTARQLGVPLEDTVAMVAMLQDVGLDASEAGSATATMLTKLSAPSKKASAEMAAMGISFQDAKGNMLPMADVLGQLVKSAEKSGGNMKQVAFFAELVGLRGQKAALNLQDLFKKGKVEELTKELAGAAGSAEKMAAIRMDTIYGDLEQLGGSVETLSIELFKTQSGPLRKVVQGMASWIDANKEFLKTSIVGAIEKGIQVVDWFATGLKTGFRSALPLVKGLGAALGLIFGDNGKTMEMQAFTWGERIGKWGTAFAVLAVSVKAARIAIFLFGAVTKAVEIATIAWGVAVKGVHGAMLLYEIATKAGVAQTLALSVASKTAAADSILMKTGFLNAAGSFDTLATKIGLAAVALAALYAAWSQLEDFKNQNGGWDGVLGFLGVGTQESGLAGINEVMDRQARERADREGRDYSVRGPTPQKLEALPSYGPPTARQYFDNAYNSGPASPVAGYGFGPQPQGPDFGMAPAPQPQQASTPWDNVNPTDFKGMFTGTVSVEIKDPGDNVKSVETKDAGKGLAPPNKRSGTP